MGVGRLAEAVGVGAQAFADWSGGVGCELVEFVGAFAELSGVGVGADGVAAAGSAVVLPWGGRAGFWFAERVVVLEGEIRNASGLS